VRLVGKDKDALVPSELRMQCWAGHPPVPQRLFARLPIELRTQYGVCALVPGRYSPEQLYDVVADVGR